MPTAPRGRCTAQACSALRTKGSRCDAHQPKAWSRTSTRQGWQGGSTRAWRKARAAQLAAEPVCQACSRRLATTVDHITPLSQGGDFLDPANHQSLCQSCHDIKSEGERTGAILRP